MPSAASPLHNAVARAASPSTRARGGATTAVKWTARVSRAAFGTTLVAYFSRTGTTRVIAGQIARSLDAHLFEIEPTESYPADYFAMVEQATRERDTGFAPAIMGMVPKLASYETIFLDFPVWGETVPSPIRSFLSSHDLTGKRLIPVITHGGYGVGNSLEFLREAAPNARILEGFPFEGPQERQAVTRVMEWLPVAASQLQY